MALETGIDANQFDAIWPDLFATLLHQLGIDHNALTYEHHGRPETPTDSVVTDARVVEELLA